MMYTKNKRLSIYKEKFSMHKRELLILSVAILNDSRGVESRSIQRKIKQLMKILFDIDYSFNKLEYVAKKHLKK